MPPPAARKIASPAALTRTARRLSAQGRRVVFTNGCFDLLHAGHITLLERARRLGDVLIVGINSDRSVRGLKKGPGRPVVPQADRALVLASLASVDFVTVFHEDTPERLIAYLRPQVLVKGADWNISAVIGREMVRRAGGRVVRIPLVKGRSTSALIAHIRARRGR